MSAIGVPSDNVYRHSFFQFAANNLVEFRSPQANLDIKPQKNICTINHKKIINLSKNHKKIVSSLINIHTLQNHQFNTITRKNPNQKFHEGLKYREAGALPK